MSRSHRLARRGVARVRPPSADGPAPLLVLGSGQRCGSTLVQRLLSSHPNVLIWGEQVGQLGEVLRASRELRRWNALHGAPARGAFARNGYHSFMANLLPAPEVVDEAARAYLQALFAAPATAEGAGIWGFKEVRLGLHEAELVRGLFPQARVVHVTRDPRDVLTSLDWWERSEHEDWSRENTLIALDSWRAVNESFAGAAADRPWLQSWRYEDVVANPDVFVQQLSTLTELDPGDLDQSVFGVRVADFRDDRRDLRAFDSLPDDTRALLDEDIRAVASHYGYSV